MIPAPKRRWLRWSLRGICTLIALLALWLGYEVNWIHKRHAVLASGHFTTESPAGTTSVVTAPGLLWLFGEAGYESIWFIVPKGDDRDGIELTDRERAELDYASRWFPEAEAGEWWQYGSVEPETTAGPSVTESERNPVDELNPFNRRPDKGLIR